MLDIIRLQFDPTIAPFGLTVRLETLALAGVVFVALVLAAVGAGRMRSRFEANPDGSAEDATRLRRDDLILIAFGAVPGAVVGGRLDYGLIHFDYFSVDPGSLTDPGQGGLALSLAVVFGSVTALAVALLLAAPIGRWLHVASGPLLVGLGLGKLAMVLGADGQGQFSDAGWATAYLRPGPWQSVSASSPALPSQALEGILVLLAPQRCWPSRSRCGFVCGAGAGSSGRAWRRGESGGCSRAIAASSRRCACGRWRVSRPRSPGATRRSPGRSGPSRSC